MSKRILLIDADILVYQTACRAEKPIDWGDGFWTLHSFEDEAVLDLEKRIASIKETLKGDELVFALTTTEKNFRKDVYPLYKSNRKETRKPLVWKPLRDYLHANYTTFERPGLEGDDCLGILATKTWVGNPERILVSIDKDFKCIPCTYYNLDKGTTIEIDEYGADYWHMLQTLTGDATDGYPGCPDIGPKTAEKILKGVIEKVQEGMPNSPLTPYGKRLYMWDAVVNTYEKAGLSEAVALQMARCARILRACDYDFTNKRPKLWEPPKA
ncbi:MAG: hypothetical protein A4E20_01360 [Nitrospira sp. SG-bin2]|nr:MAG: hypothetical protein A4E20_01360 [Nitrospira sp. SG-bin2]